MINPKKISFIFLLMTCQHLQVLTTKGRYLYSVNLKISLEATQCLNIGSYHKVCPANPLLYRKRFSPCLFHSFFASKFVLCAEVLYIPPSLLPIATGWKTPTPGRNCLANFPSGGGFIPLSGTSRTYVISPVSGLIS